jgi:hypothetical protein
MDRILLAWRTCGDCAESTSKVVQMAIRDFVEHYRAMNPERALK